MRVYSDHLILEEWEMDVRAIKWKNPVTDATLIWGHNSYRMALGINKISDV